MQDSTILLPNYNNEKVLPLMFSLMRRTIDCSSVHMIAVDDGSEDESLRVLKEEGHNVGFASFDVISLPHGGIVKALNAGLEATKTEYIFRIDGDATAETLNWLSILREWLVKFPAVGLVGGQVIFDSGCIHSFGRSVISEYGLYDMGCSVFEEVGSRTFDSHVWRPKSDFINRKPYEVDTLLGVCAAFRRSDALSIGGFDERFSPVWIEDDDFGLSVRHIGKKVVVDPRIKVLHRTSLRGSRKPKDEEINLEVNKRRGGAISLKGLVYSAIPIGLKKLIKAQICGNRLPSAQSSSLYIPSLENNPWRMDILKGHYASWKLKWGFDPLNPGMDAIFNRYWESEICWKVNPEKLASSRKFIERAIGLQ